MKVTNRDTGIQVEWRDILFTLQTNESHGVSGSVAVKDGTGKVLLLEFHGNQRGKLMPFHVHEDSVDDIP